MEREVWTHLVAGASGGFATAVLTSPLDVLRTRLQSDFYNAPSTSSSSGAVQRTKLGASIRHGLASFKIFGDIARTEGWRGFFRGLGPSLAGVVPATAIKFQVYGNSKIFWATVLNQQPGEKTVAVDALAAMSAGVATSTATNPIWVVKTRLQLDAREGGAAGKERQYRNSWDCTKKIMRYEGVGGLYKGLSASYLGTVETVVHLALYEQIKPIIRTYLGDAAGMELGEKSKWDELKAWISTTGAAGSAKLAATGFWYPHEVVRTRLRQAPTANGPKYTGLWQCFTTIAKQEGMAGLYGGLFPHMARSIPSAMITLGVYEFVLRTLA